MPRMPRKPRAPRRRKLRLGRSVARIYKKRVMLQNEPSFTETISFGDIGSGPGVFKFRISDIPEFVADYANLYTQYRINWMKVMLLPQYLSSDHNTAQANQAAGIGYSGMSRIAWAIQDSPNVQAPANEAEVLQDNGAKVKPIGSYWKCSFKPVPDIAQVNAGGNPVPTKQYRKQWFNYVGFPNDPQHGSIQYFITEPGLNNVTRYNVYVKVNFSLRDPK